MNCFLPQRSRRKLRLSPMIGTLTGQEWDHPKRRSEDTKHYIYLTVLHFVLSLLLLLLVIVYCISLKSSHISEPIYGVDSKWKK